MNDLKKARIKTMMKYTWPFYIVAALVVGFSFSFIFGVTHKMPAFKKLTIFISGEVTDSKKLKDDLLTKYEQKELKSVTYIDSKPDDLNYSTKLSVPGYNTADILIIPFSKLESVKVSSFGLDLSASLIAEYYQSFTLYTQDAVAYGVKVNKEIVKEYMTLPNEDCYMVLSGKSENTGEYSITQNKEHDTALNVVKDWGM